MGVSGKTKNNLANKMKRGNTKKSFANVSNKSISPKKTDKFLNLPSSANSELSDDNS
jgi:hypothetical protein